MNDFLEIGGKTILLMIILFITFWFVKLVTYKMMYEDMVTATIIQTVKPSCIQKENTP